MSRLGWQTRRDFKRHKPHTPVKTAGCAFALLAVAWNLIFLVWTFSGPRREEGGELTACFAFPEASLFYFSTDAPEPQSSCYEKSTRQARSLQGALQLCLGQADCGWALWDKDTETAILCLSEPVDELGTPPKQGPCHSLQRSRVLVAVRKSYILGGGVDVQECPDGQLQVRHGRRREQDNSICDVCRDSYCGDLPGATLTPGIDSQVQRAVGGMFPKSYKLRGFNPSLFSHAGQNYIILRVSNGTICPQSPAEQAAKSVSKLFQWKGKPEEVFLASQVVMCPMDPTLSKITEPCIHTPIDVDKFVKPKNFTAFKTHHGLEDARAVSYNGRVFLIGTVNRWRMDPTTYSKDTTSRLKSNERPSWAELHKPLNNIAMVRLSKDLRSVEHGAVLECQGGNQKNWVPLVYKGGLYLVVQLLPVVIVRVNPSDLSCAVIQKDPPVATSYQAVMPEETPLRGGSPFIPLPDNRFLGIVHHSVPARNGAGHVYTHHFVTLSVEETPAGQPRFVLDWLSDSFRLPDGGEHKFNIQFAGGILQSRGDLHIAYGLTDCITNIVRLTNFHEKLSVWESGSLGTQWASQQVASSPNDRL